MKPKPFALERYFAKYEFKAKYMLCNSDCDGILQSQLLEMANDETKALWENLTLGYTESLGNPLLRKEISKLYKGVSDSDVLVLTPEEGIFILMNVLLQKGDHLITTFPGYQSLYEIAESLECEISKWEPEEDKGWAFNIETLKTLIKENTKLIVLNSPHNPTGAILSREDFDSIVELAKERNINIFFDEMYRFLEYDKNDRLPSICEVYYKGISLFGMSKTFGMAGVRIGWLTTRDKDLYNRLATFKDYTTICSSAPSEILSLIALQNKDQIINENLKVIENNLKLLDEFFLKYQNLFSWTRPKAGTIGFPRILIDIGAEEFCSKLIESEDILLLPSTVYAYDDKHFRIGFGRKNMPEVLGKFGEYLDRRY